MEVALIALKDETFDGTFPFAPHYFDGNGFQMHYVDEGGGEPIVLVHGDPTWGYLYRNFIHALARHRRCIVPDHMHGQIRRASRAISIPAPASHR